MHSLYGQNATSKFVPIFAYLNPMWDDRMVLLANTPEAGRDGQTPPNPAAFYLPTKIKIGWPMNEDTLWRCAGWFFRTTPHW